LQLTVCSYKRQWLPAVLAVINDARGSIDSLACFQKCSAMFTAHICRFLHQCFTDVVHSVLVQAQAVASIRPLDHALDILAYELVQFLKHHLGLLHMQWCLYIRRQSSSWVRLHCQAFTSSERGLMMCLVSVYSANKRQVCGALSTACWGDQEPMSAEGSCRHSKLRT